MNGGTTEIADRRSLLFSSAFPAPSARRALHPSRSINSCDCTKPGSSKRCGESDEAFLYSRWPMAPQQKITSGYGSHAAPFRHTNLRTQACSTSTRLRNSAPHIITPTMFVPSQVSLSAVALLSLPRKAGVDRSLLRATKPPIRVLPANPRKKKKDTRKKREEISKDNTNWQQKVPSAKSESFARLV